MFRLPVADERGHALYREGTNFGAIWPTHCFHGFDESNSLWSGLVRIVGGTPNLEKRNYETYSSSGSKSSTGIDHPGTASPASATSPER
jgi:hypothetical protein